MIGVSQIVCSLHLSHVITALLTVSVFVIVDVGAVFYTPCVFTCLSYFLVKFDVPSCNISLIQ